MAFLKPNIKGFCSHLKNDFIEIKNEIIHFKNNFNKFDFKLVSNKIKLLIEKIVLIIIKDLQKILTIRRILLNVILIIGFIYFHNQINQFLENYLAYHGTFSSSFVFGLLIISFIVVSAGIIYILLKNKYQPTLNEINTIAFALFFLLNLKSKNWKYSSFDFFGFKIFYIDFIEILLLTFLVINFIRYILVIATHEKLDKSKNFLLNDNAILNEQDDKLDCLSIVNKLTEILLNENHEKSLTIGLVGPWGNGKSSVLNLVQQRIQNKNVNFFDTEKIISFKFLPYLNHKEDDIINEFFTSFSNELAKYNGKLSNLITEYSSKITDLYENKNVLGFIEDHVTNFKNSSASELYDSINEMLVESDKKIIVFLDDLDRLNKNEILQVLKLIRNTADFRNTIFLVAMDKEYVVKNLRKSKKIFDTSFIDKFFQLEVYLPEIDISVLRDYFILEIQKPFENMPLDFKERVHQAMNNHSLLFSDYIKNFRDAKRIINQIRFDLLNYKEDHNYLNLKDFINFTFFKLKFPKIMKDLNDGKVNFLEIDSRTGIYSLIKQNGNSNSSSDLLDLFYIKRTYNIENLEKYKLYDALLKEDCKEFESINCDDRILLVKTLAFLFGDENSPVNIDSIRKQNNFKMLMQQRIFSDYYTNYEFEVFLVLEKLNIKAYLLALIESKKLNQLLDRLKDYVTDDIAKIKVIINCLAILYENYIEYGINHVDVLPLLSKFVENKTTEPEITSWIKENVFEDKTLTPKTRLELLGHLWNSRLANKLWNIQEKEFQTLTKETFEEYLNQYQDNLWNVNNYEIYGVYHDIKAICHDEINKVLKDFWNKNRIETLCAQTVDLYMYSDHSFTITDTVNEIFGDRNKFVEFVDRHSDKELPAIKEFLKLFELLQIVNFSKYILFDFKESKLMIEKIKHIKSIPTRPQNNKVIKKREIFFETDYLELLDKIMPNVNYFEGINLMGFKHNDKGYLSVVIDESLGIKGLSSFISKLKSNPKILNVEDFEHKFPENMHSEEFKLNIKDKYYLKTISIQPSLNDNNPNNEIN